MAYKCKNCGYIFKKTDSDLCPECFTAREDIECTDFDEEHDHDKDELTEPENEEMTEAEKDFAEQEIHSETAARSKEEIQERAADIMDSLKRRFSDDIPPNTFENNENSSFDDTDKPINFDPSSVDILNGVSRKPSSSSISASGSFKGRMIVIFVVIIIIMMTSLMLLSNYFKALIKNKNEKNATENVYVPPEAKENEFVISSENSRLSVTINNFTCEPENDSVKYFSDINHAQIITDGYDLEETCKATVLYADFTLDNENCNITDITVTASGDNGSYTVIDPRTKTDSSTAQKFPIYLSDLMNDYKITVSCKNGTEDAVLEKKFSFSELYNDSVERLPDNNAETEPAAEPEGFDYSYSAAPFKTSLRDTKGNNVQIIRGKLAYEIGKEEPVLEKITMTDEQLKSTEWAFYEIKLVSTDTSHSPIDCTMVSLDLEGYDTNNKKCYSYNPEDISPYTELLIPICKQVQYFKLKIVYDDVKGTRNETEINFDLNGLDNSK